jgi:GntR family transcriptional regulator
MHVGTYDAYCSYRHLTVKTGGPSRPGGRPEALVYLWYVQTPPKDPKGVRAVNTDDTLWEAIAGGLRDDITAGRYKPGDTIPSESDLAAEWEASRTTVRRALSALQGEGLVTEGHGRLGRQVQDRRPLIFYAVRSESRKRAAERRGLGTDAWVADAAEQGHVAGQDIAVAIEEASPDIAGRLGLDAGARVFVRMRVRSLDGKPHDLNDTHYPADIAEGTRIAHPADIPEGTIAYMAELGYVQVRFSDDVAARMPTPAEARELRMAAGVPLLVQYRTGYTVDRPVKVTVTRWPADRVRLVWEFQG